MSSGNRRLDKLKSHLTPKQAVLLWLQDAHAYHTVADYLHYLQTQPDNAWPLRRLGEQMTASVEQTLKGKPKAAIHQALRRADLDVLFLFFLHQQVNGKLMEEERHYATKALLLATGLTSLMREKIDNDQGMWNRMMVALRLPYPLDPETATAVDAAIQNHLIPWETLELC